MKFPIINEDLFAELMRSLEGYYQDELTIKRENPAAPRTAPPYTSSATGLVLSADTSQEK